MQRRRGFTFIELMVVCVIIVLIITMAIPIYVNQVKRTRESVLKSDLFTMRVAIDRYMFEFGHAPRGLDDLTAGGYLQQIPTDPMTGHNNTWRTEPEDSKSTVDSDRPGIGYVHSGSDKIALDGTRYSEW